MNIERRDIRNAGLAGFASVILILTSATATA